MQTLHSGQGVEPWPDSGKPIQQVRGFCTMRIGINAQPPISAHRSLLPHSSSDILPGKIRGAANSRAALEP